MRRSSLIGHVIELFDIIRKSHQSADGVVKDFFRTRRYLGSKDRRYITDTLFGTIRNLTLLQVYIDQAVHRLGSGQLPLPVPPIVFCAAYHAKILAETSEALLPVLSNLWRISVPTLQCESFIEALSAVELPEEVKETPVRRISVTYSFPESILGEWIRRFGEEQTEALCRALNMPAPITIRVNTLKTTVQECQRDLQHEGVTSRPTVFSPFGLILEKRVNVQALHTFKSGFFEMQDEGSQLLAMLLEPAAGETIVDACAGSGGKTLHIAALMKNKGTLIAVDVEERRVNGIRSRLARAGVISARLFLAERDSTALQVLNRKADRVLIDAPCSGVGTFRRNPAAKMSFSDDYVASISRTQRSIIQKYSEMVKPGGRLVYATCTLLERENEDTIQWFLSAHPDFLLLSAPEILLKNRIIVDSHSPFLSLLPHKTTTDGFFGAVMSRRM